MARVINSEKGFKLIECSMSETLAFGGMGICDSCGNAAFSGVLISVLSSWYCKECFNSWHARANRYKEDESHEVNAFRVFSNLLKPSEESEVKMSKLTPQQAIDQGYTHYTIDQSGEFGLISHILEPWFDKDFANEKLLVLDKVKHAFNFSAEDIRDILHDHINGQEEYSNEDDELSNELDEADFDKIAELVNVGFDERFMFPTEIELDLSGLKGGNSCD